MKITLCGSIASYRKMNDVLAQLEMQGHDVQLPPATEPGEDGNPITVEEYYQIRKSRDAKDWVWERKSAAILEHFAKIEWCDAILVVNEEKHGVAGYVGGNTLMEMGLALYLGKKIFLLNPVPDVAYREEILGCKPVIVHGDLATLGR